MIVECSTCKPKRKTTDDQRERWLVDETTTHKWQKAKLSSEWAVKVLNRHQLELTKRNPFMGRQQLAVTVRLVTFTDHRTRTHHRGFYPNLISTDNSSTMNSRHCCRDETADSP